MKLDFAGLHSELCLLMTADQFYALPVDGPEGGSFSSWPCAQSSSPSASGPSMASSLPAKAEPWRYPLCREIWLLAARRAVSRLSAWLGDVVWQRDSLEASWLLPDAVVDRLNLERRVACAVSEAVRQRILGFDVAPDLDSVIASLCFV